MYILTTTNGYITGFTLTAANVDDRYASLELTSFHKDIKVIALKPFNIIG